MYSKKEGVNVLFEELPLLSQNVQMQTVSLLNYTGWIPYQERRESPAELEVENPLVSTD